MHYSPHKRYSYRFCLFDYLNDFLGQYMFILPASKEIHEYAVLTSETVHVQGAGKCLVFWYYMQGNNAGSIHVQMEIISKSLTTVWQLSDADHSVWLQAHVPLKSPQIPFKASIYLQYNLC